MDSCSQSIYGLITKLCEKYVTGNKQKTVYPTKIDVKKVRSKCYEVLLSKTLPKKCIAENLENNNDPFCHLLAWRLQLMIEFNLPQHAEKLRQCSEKLQELNTFTDATYSNTVLLLLQLRRLPKNENKIMETTLNKDDLDLEEFTLHNHSSTFAYYDDSKFQLPEERTFTEVQFENDHFRLRNKKVSFRTSEFESVAEFFNAGRKNFNTQSGFFDTKFKDEGYESPSKSESGNLWEIASRLPRSEHRTWEAFECFSSKKEPPFLGESGPESATWLQDLSTSLGRFIIMEDCVGKGSMRNIITSKQFIKDVKHLLVGVDSETFKYNSKRELFLVPGTCIEGLSSAAIESYCTDFLICGNCYTGLNNLCTPSHSTLSYVPNGYIFSELGESIKRYLAYYCLATLAISNTTHLLAFHAHTRQLRTHITILASVCKVGPFTESGQIPHGVALLNYLYQKVMSLTNKDVIMVLYSVLYPCCQVYFSRFLQQWILEGSVDDPYGEFFINISKKYVSTRGRTYWTRTYTLREDIVPDFITDLRTDILFCGKAMNLLKLCVPNSPLCLYLMDKRPNIISCCVMAEQLSNLELNNHYYYLEATALSGPRISLSQTVASSHEEDKLFLRLVAKQRAATLSRIESERKKEIERRSKKRQAEIQMLREQYLEAQKLKRAKNAEELEAQLRTLEKDIKMQNLHDRIIQEEAKTLIEFYNQLFQASENRRRLFEKRSESLRKALLDDGEPSKTDVSSKTTEVTSKSLDSDIVPKISNKSLATSVSTDTFLSTFDDLQENKSEEYVSADNGDSTMSLGISTDQSVESLNMINANSSGNIKDAAEKQQTVINKNTKDHAPVENLYDINPETVSESFEEANHSDDNLILTEAQKNKLKVMSSEYGTRLTNAQKHMMQTRNKSKHINENNENLVPAQQNFQVAQKNKVKVTAMEMGNFNEPVVQKNATNVALTEAQKNKLKVISMEYGNKECTKENQEHGEQNANVIFSQNLEAAQRNKARVMALELGITTTLPEENGKQDRENANLIFTENMKAAQKNKANVMSLDLGVVTQPVVRKKSEQNDKYSGLTEAQRNKLKVMSSEYGQEINIEVKKPLSIIEINRNKMLSSSECFYTQQTITDKRENTTARKKNYDNENFLNKNVNVDNTVVIDNNSDQNSNPAPRSASKKQDILLLDFSKIHSYHENIDSCRLKVETKNGEGFYSQFIRSPKFELEKISPMSIDSTPLSGVTTPSNKLHGPFDKNELESLQSCSAATTATASTTAANCKTGFNFEIDKSEGLLNLENRRSAYNLESAMGSTLLTKTITAKDASSVSPNCLKMFLQQSISIPLITQIKLVNNELLKYYINSLQYLKHLNSLRNYFFLLDGEFGRNITEGLFEKLYDANFPIELINCHTLQTLVYKALDYSTKFQENSSYLSFRINSLPKVFNLGNPDVFDCISLTYKTNWPLNILLPSDTISKYDEVFKFLLKLHRVSWVLQNVFQDLKSLVKETESSKTILLMMSSHYRRLHQCRHVMTHFIQTLQSYVVGEVLQSSWEMFEKNLEAVTNFDQLYSLHTVYIKNILFMCLLNQRSAPLRKALQKIFIVILKFYDYLRSRSWMVENNVYVHPNFKKLEDIYGNFEDLTLYLFKVGHKVVKSGYQPHLMQLLDMLDVNNYYSKRNVNDLSVNLSSR